MGICYVSVIGPRSGRRRGCVSPADNVIPPPIAQTTESMSDASAGRLASSRDAAYARPARGASDSCCRPWPGRRQRDDTGPTRARSQRSSTHDTTDRSLQVVEAYTQIDGQFGRRRANLGSSRSVRFGGYRCTTCSRRPRQIISFPCTPSKKYLVAAPATQDYGEFNTVFRGCLLHR